MEMEVAARETQPH